MTIREILDRIVDEYTIVAVCDKGNDEYLCVSDGEHIIDEVFMDVDVDGIAVSGKMLRLYIDRPCKRYSTYLDVTYSVRVELEVPIGEDVEDAFRTEAGCILSEVPRQIYSGEYCLGDYDSNEYTGNYYDMIEEM